MMIEIRGVQFINKGSELMLHAVLDKLRKEMPDTAFTMVPGPPGRPYEKIVALGIYPKLSISRLGLRLDTFAAIVPKRIRERYGLVLDREVVAVIDASGFSYSDQWGSGSSTAMAREIRRWKKRGVRVFLLPQAFGPFSSAKISRDFRTIGQTADLLYARDEESYNHVLDLVGESERIRISPDFTILVDGVVPEYWDASDPPVCIVPNCRMLDKTRQHVADRYVLFLVECAELLDQMGHASVLLAHGGPDDVSLTERIRQASSVEIRIVEEEDVLKVKGILGASRAIIASRYHALVSGLSQAVPCLGTGWSHKYAALFEDYGVPEMLLSVDMKGHELTERLAAAVNDPLRGEVQSRLRRHADEHRKAAEMMWDDVLRHL